MTALKSANKELKGMMKTVRIEDIDVSFSFLVGEYVFASIGSDTSSIFDLTNMIIFSCLLVYWDNFICAFQKLKLSHSCKVSQVPLKTLEDLFTFCCF